MLPSPTCWIDAPLIQRVLSEPLSPVRKRTSKLQATPATQLLIPSVYPLACNGLGLWGCGIEDEKAVHLSDSGVAQSEPPFWKVRASSRRLPGEVGEGQLPDWNLEP